MFARILFTIPVLALLALTPQDTVLDKTWQAHGGLARWQQQRTFQYTMKGFPLSAQMQKPNTSTVDLQSHRNRIDGEGFTVAYDGKKAWGLPDDKAAGSSVQSHPFVLPVSSVPPSVNARSCRLAVTTTDEKPPQSGTSASPCAGSATGSAAPVIPL